MAETQGTQLIAGHGHRLQVCTILATRAPKRQLAPGIYLFDGSPSVLYQLRLLLKAEDTLQARQQQVASELPSLQRILWSH